MHNLYALMHDEATIEAMNWDDLRFFLVVARLGTLSAAARELKVTQPTVGRRITALERRMGARLFARSSSGFVLTASGARALAFAERMEQDALGAERQLDGRDEGVVGSVRITASEWLVNSVLASLLRPLLSKHPKLSIELIADARHLSLARREADIALRPRRFEQPGALQRSVGRLAFAVYAERSYLNAMGAPRHGDGRGHVLIGMNDETGDVARAWLDEALPHASRSVRTNGRDAMLALARSGLGLACLARIVGDATPELQRVDLSPPIPTPTLWLGTHRDARETPRVRAVVSHLTERLRGLAPRLNPS
jgi:DNA-binding transcriptional LysR family regulator